MSDWKDDEMDRMSDVIVALRNALREAGISQASIDKIEEKAYFSRPVENNS